jgi:hypothetical protein
MGYCVVMTGIGDPGLTIVTTVVGALLAFLEVIHIGKVLTFFLLLAARWKFA